jgi:hypothetical protein
MCCELLKGLNGVDWARSIAGVMLLASLGFLIVCAAELSGNCWCDQHSLASFVVRWCCCFAC